MTAISSSKRYAGLWLSTFDTDPADLIALPPDLHVLIQRKGDETRTGRINRASQILIKFEFDGADAWDDVLNQLIEKLGGEEAVEKLLLRVGAERQHIHFQLPINGSPLQENNSLSIESLDLLSRLRLWVGFDFSSFDPSDAPRG